MLRGVRAFQVVAEQVVILLDESEAGVAASVGGHPDRAGHSAEQGRLLGVGLEVATDDVKAGGNPRLLRRVAPVPG